MVSGLRLGALSLLCSFADFFPSIAPAPYGPGHLPFLFGLVWLVPESRACRIFFLECGLMSLCHAPCGGIWSGSHAGRFGPFLTISNLTDFDPRDGLFFAFFGSEVAQKSKCKERQFFSFLIEKWHKRMRAAVAFQVPKFVPRPPPSAPLPRMQKKTARCGQGATKK